MSDSNEETEASAETLGIVEEILKVTSDTNRIARGLNVEHNKLSEKLNVIDAQLDRVEGATTLNAASLKRLEAAVASANGKLDRIEQHTNREHPLVGKSTGFVKANEQSVLARLGLSEPIRFRVEIIVKSPEGAGEAQIFDGSELRKKITGKAGVLDYKEDVFVDLRNDFILRPTGGNNSMAKATIKEVWN